jgi:hypothetical protein
MICTCTPCPVHSRQQYAAQQDQLIAERARWAQANTFSGIGIRPDLLGMALQEITAAYDALLQPGSGLASPPQTPPPGPPHATLGPEQA